MVFTIPHRVRPHKMDNTWVDVLARRKRAPEAALAQYYRDIWGTECRNLSRRLLRRKRGRQRQQSVNSRRDSVAHRSQPSTAWPRARWQHPKYTAALRIGESSCGAAQNFEHMAFAN